MSDDELYDVKLSVLHGVQRLSSTMVMKRIANVRRIPVWPRAVSELTGTLW